MQGPHPDRGEARHRVRRQAESKLNIDEAPQTPSQFGVRAVPTIVFFNGGKAVDTIVGLKKESELRERIKQLVQSAPARPAK
jgi:thioredoxin-like negative regulator of GroEL